VLTRVAAAQLIGVHRVLFQETLRRTIAGEDHDEIAAALTGSAQDAFDLLEPSLGGYAVSAHGDRTPRRGRSSRQGSGPS
jgi:hypothetical protein